MSAWRDRMLHATSDLGKGKSKRKKMTLCLRYQEIQEMINRHIFRYIEFIVFTVLLEHLRAF